MTEKEVLIIYGKQLEIDPSKLNFNEASLNDYIQHEGGYFDNFGGWLALAEKEHQLCDMEYDKLYNSRFAETKDNEGGSDKFVEAKIKADPDVIDARTKAINAKYNVKRLQQHLRAWDKNHDNAMSMGHMLRKEMDKLQMDIMGNHNFTGNSSDVDYDLDKKLESKITPFPKKENEETDM